MQKENVFAIMNNQYYQLTSSEKKVADYVTRNQQKTPYLSITELAEESEVAEATVTRFCRRLGYKGYNAFKLALANTNAKEGTEVSALSGEVETDDNIGAICQKIRANAESAIAQTASVIRPEPILQAADLLCQAPKVLCMGQGASMLLAHEAAHLFTTVCPVVFPVWDSHLQVITASQMKPGEVVLFFSYSGSTRDVVDTLKVIKDRGASVILVTRFPRSPAAAHADIILECGGKEAPLQTGSISARIAQLFLMDVLFQEVCRRDIPAWEDHREQVAIALVDKHL